MSASNFTFDIRSKSILNEDKSMKQKESPKPHYYNHRKYVKTTQELSVEKKRSKMKFDRMKEFLYSVIYTLNSKNKLDTPDSIFERISKEIDFDKETLKTFVCKKSAWPGGLLGKFITYINTHDEMLGIPTLECKEFFKKINSNSPSFMNIQNYKEEVFSSQEIENSHSLNDFTESNSSDTESDASSENENNFIGNDSNLVEENSNLVEGNSNFSHEHHHHHHLPHHHHDNTTGIHINDIRDISNRVIFIPKNGNTCNKEINGLKVFAITNEIDKKEKKDQELASIPKLKLEHFIHEISDGNERKEISLKNFFKTFDLLKNCIESNYDKKVKDENSTTTTTSNSSNTSKQTHQGEKNSIPSLDSNSTSTSNNTTKGYQSYPYNLNNNNNNNINSNSNNSTIDTSSTTTTSSNSTNTGTNTGIDTSSCCSPPSSMKQHSKNSLMIHELENILLKTAQSFLNDYSKE